MAAERPDRVFVTEGPSDAAALLSVGLDVVGVPSAGGCADLLARLVRRLEPEDVVIVADGDGPGQRGAMTLARCFTVHCIGANHKPTPRCKGCESLGRRWC